MIDTARLEDIASRASKGPYEVTRRDDDSGDIDYAVMARDGEIASCFDAQTACGEHVDAQQAKYNAAWIAEATPDTVMILVDYARALEDYTRAIEIKLSIAQAELANLRRTDGIRRANGGGA